MNRVLNGLPILVTLLLLTSCNMPASQPPSNNLTVEQQAGTVVAATMNAPRATTSTVASASSAAPTAPPASGPALKITAATATCRRGPSPNFAEITTIDGGTTLPVIGKNPESNYWQVRVPDSGDTCWISGDDAKVSGDTAALPEATAQASNPKLPVGPGALFYSFTCPFPAGGQQQVTVNLTWPDKADNETGYRVYRDGKQIADLPADSTSYSDTTSIAPGAVLTYQVAAYNDAGSSPQAVTGNGDPITCQ